MARSQAGTIYLLHLSSKIADHAGHYLGWAASLESRLAEHRAGTGARLMAVAKERGLSFECVRTWTGTRDDERKLKKQKNAARLCPICHDGFIERNEARRRVRRQERRVHHVHPLERRSTGSINLPDMREVPPSVGDQLEGEWDIPF